MKLNKKTVYSFLLIIGLISFTLQVFVLEWPDGNLGLILCMIETALIIGSFIGLCQLSKEFSDGFLKFIKVIFRFWEEKWILFLN